MQKFLKWFRVRLPPVKKFKFNEIVKITNCNNLTVKLQSFKRIKNFNRVATCLIL